MVDIKNIPAELKSSCRFCVWKFEKRNGQKTKMPYNPANGDRAKINDLRTFADFKTTLVTYAMGGYDGIGIAVGSGIGAFDIDHCIREDGTLNDTADTVLSVFPTAYVEKSPSGKGLRGFFHVPEDYVYDKTVYYINNRSKGLEVYMPGATNRFVTVTGDVYRTGEIPNDETAMTTLLDSLMKRNKQVQQTHFQHHSYLDDEAVIAHANEASNSEKFKRLFAGEWEDLYGSQSDADMALLSILAFWCGCDEEQMDRIFRTSGLMRPKWDRKQAGSTYGAISIRNTVNTCASVYIPVNAQDIVDEEFANLDADDEKSERPPDITKLTLSLEEMAPHTNPRYGRDEIGLGNMFSDFFKPIARYNSERGIWFVYDGVVWQPDMENLKVAELAKYLADKLYLFALKITEEDARKRFIDRVKKLQLRKHRDTMLKDAKSVFPLSMKQYFEKENIDTLDAKGELILTILSALAQDESRSISDNIRWSIQKKFQSGVPHINLKRMLGYELGANKQWVIVPEQAEIIRYIFDRFVKGQTANKIAQELNQMEKFTVNGKKWSASSILIVLRNEKYVGDIEMQKTITKDFLTHRSSINKGEAPRYYVKNHHVGIIDRVTWDKVQTMLFEKPRADMTKGPGKKKVKSIKGSPFGNLRCGAILENGPDAGKPCGEGFFRTTYTGVANGYSDERSLKATGEDTGEYLEKYTYSYPVWRCKRKVGERDGEPPKNGSPDQKAYCRSKKGCMSDEEKEAANKPSAFRFSTIAETIAAISYVSSMSFAIITENIRPVYY